MESLLESWHAAASLIDFESADEFVRVHVPRLIVSRSIPFPTLSFFIRYIVYTRYNWIREKISIRFRLFNFGIRVNVYMRGEKGKFIN